MVSPVVLESGVRRLSGWVSPKTEPLCPARLRAGQLSDVYTDFQPILVFLFLYFTSAFCGTWFFQFWNTPSSVIGIY